MEGQLIEPSLKGTYTPSHDVLLCFLAQLSVVSEGGGRLLLTLTADSQCINCNNGTLLNSPGENLSLNMYMYTHTYTRCTYTYAYTHTHNTHALTMPAHIHTYAHLNWYINYVIIMYRCNYRYMGHCGKL